MKKILLLALLAVLFFACSNDGLDVKTPGKQFCSVSEQGQSKCYNVSADICIAIGGEVVGNCSLEISSSSAGIDVEESSSSGEGGDGDSSSSGEGGDGDSSSSGEGEIGDSSSSGEVGGSSSSEVVAGPSSSGGVEVSSSSEVVVPSSSSLSMPEPIVSGVFEFRNFNYSSSSSKIYFLPANNMYVSSSPPPSGQGKLYSTLAITNAVDADCGNITVEVTGGGLPAIMPSAQPGETANIAGDITATAVANCNNVKKELAVATATVVPNAAFGDCVLPSIYVYRNEPVRDLVVVENNYGRCPTIRYTPQNYPNSASSNATTFSTTASCQGGTLTGNRVCSGLSINVAQNNLQINHTNFFSASSGSTVIEIDLPVLPEKIGCRGGQWVNGCIDSLPGGNDPPALSTHCGYFSFLINKVSVPGRYYADTEIDAASYSNNGNRILLESNQGVITECQIITPP